MKQDINRFRVYWIGGHRHLMVFGYALPHASVFRATAKLWTSTMKLRRFPLMVAEGERQGWDNIAWVNDQGGMIHLSLPFAKWCRDQVVDYLKKLEDGTLEKHDHDPGEDVPGGFSDN